MTELQHSKPKHTADTVKLAIMTVFILLGLLYQPVSSAKDNPSWVFSPLEIELHQLLIESIASPPNEVLKVLGDIKQKKENDTTPPKTLITLYQCVIKAEQLPEEDNNFMKELNKLYKEVPSALTLAAKYKCQQIIAYKKQQGALNLEYGFYAFTAAKEAHYPLLLYWISLEHAYNLMEAGFLEQALAAIQLSLDIAEANKSNQKKWKKDSLSTLSLIQSDLKQYDDALDSNKRAFDMAMSPDGELVTLMSRAYILINADRLEEAKTTLESLLDVYKDELYDDDKITILTNISNILYRQGKNDENLTLTKSMLAQINEKNSESVVAYAKMFRALALLRANRIKDAEKHFNQGLQWFRENSQYPHLAGHLKSYSKELASLGFYSKAYNMLIEYLELTQKIQEETDKTNALFLNAMINKDQKIKTIDSLRQQQKVAQASLKNKELLNIIWLTLFLSVIVLGVVLIYFYRKQRKMNDLLMEKNKQLNYQNIHDPLTEINNRRFFNEFLEKKKLLNIQSRVLLILLDLDRFKQINDAFGHSSGDKVLKEVSSRLSKTLRSSDCIIRWGGEEFLLYIETSKIQESTPIIIQRLLNIVSKEPMKINQELITVTASLGFVEYDTPNIDIKNHIKKADQYLYESKTAGRNRATGLSLTPNNTLYYIKPNNVSKLRLD